MLKADRHGCTDSRTTAYLGPLFDTHPLFLAQSQLLYYIQIFLDIKMILIATVVWGIRPLRKNQTSARG